MSACYSLKHFRCVTSLVGPTTMTIHTVDHFDIDSINFCAGCLMTKLQIIRHRVSYDVVLYITSVTNFKEEQYQKCDCHSDMVKSEVLLGDLNGSALTFVK